MSHCYKILIEFVGFPWMTCTWVLKVVSVRCQWWVHWVCFCRRVMDERLPLFSRWSADKYRHAEEDGGPEGREIAARDEENFQAPDVTSATTTPKGPVGHGNFPCLHPNSTPSSILGPVPLLAWNWLCLGKNSRLFLWPCFGLSIHYSSIFSFLSFTSDIHVCSFKLQALPRNQYFQYKYFQGCES